MINKRSLSYFEKMRLNMRKKAFFSSELFLLRKLAEDDPEITFAKKFDTINKPRLNSYNLFDKFQKTLLIMSEYIKHFNEVLVKIPEQEIDYEIDEHGFQQQIVITDKEKIREHRKSDCLFGPAMEIFDHGYIEGFIVWHYKNLNLTLKYFLGSKYDVHTEDADLFEKVKLIRELFKKEEKCSQKQIDQLFNKGLRDEHLNLIKIVAGAVTHSADNVLRQKHLKEDTKLFSRASSVPGISLNENNKVLVTIEYLDFLNQVTDLILGGIDRVLANSKQSEWPEQSLNIFFPDKQEYRRKLFNELFVMVFNKQLEKFFITYRRDNIEYRINPQSYQEYRLILDRDPQLKEKPVLYKSLKYIIDSYRASGSNVSALEKYLELMEVYAIIRNTIAYELFNEIPKARKNDLLLIKKFGAKHKKELIIGKRELALTNENIQFFIDQLSTFKEALAAIVFNYLR